MAEVLQVINSSPGNLTPVFDTILEKALSLCEAAFGSLARFDGDAFDWLATRGVPEAWFAEFRATGYRPTPGLALYRFQHGGDDIEHVVDITADETGRSAIADRHRFAELTGARTAIWIALRKDRTLRGALVIYRREVRPFTDKQIALLQSFAAQAVIAMENARLLTETREALEQQTATAEVLQVINSSPGDLGPVFDAMLEKAMRLCEAKLGFLSTYDGARFTAAAMQGVPENYARDYFGGPYLPGPGTTHDRLVKGEEVVHVVDLAAENLGDRRRQAVIQRLGVRTILAVPLAKDGRLLGGIHVYRREVRSFSQKQIALLQNFAAQAVIAMENARLITETREALEQQTATAEVLGVINSSPGDLAPVFEAILEKAHRLCGAIRGALALYDGKSFRAVAIHGYPEEVAEMIRRPYGSNVFFQRIVEGDRYVQIPDFQAVSAELGDPVGRAALDHLDLRTWLAVPLRKEGLLLGYISAVRPEVCPFSDKEITLLESFAQQAVIAMQNARLLGELRQRTEEVAELNRGLEARVAEQVEELGRVGRLKRFLAPQLAELIVSQGEEKILESHRREIVVVFCDLRGYTAFTETAEPEEVLDFLREYHGALGPLVSQFEGTLDQFSGDGIMVFFNDPVQVPDPAERAVKMAMAMRKAAGELIAAWRRRGSELGFGVGIAQGYATLGQIGFSERSGYTAIGTVCNLAARLCAEARDGQILLSSRVAGAVEAIANLEDLGNLELKGLSRPVAAFNVIQ